MKPKVLLVEDNVDIANLVSINLRMLDLEVCHIDDGLAAYKRLHEDFDLAILDIMLPGTDGISLCKRIRQLNSDMPVMFLTSKSTETDLVVGLDSGADDYLTKPFSVLELQARVKAMLRRCKPIQIEDSFEPRLDFGPLIIDPSRHQISLDQQDVPMTVKEFELLSYMAQHPERVFSRQQLLTELWGYQHDSSGHTVNSTVNRLRSKLEKNPAKPEWIQTVWGVGYKFSANRSGTLPC